MAIPPFNIDGVAPPFVGARGPGGSSADMSPYVARKVDRVFSVEQLIRFNRELVNVNSSAKILVKRVRRSGATSGKVLLS